MIQTNTHRDNDSPIVPGIDADERLMLFIVVSPLIHINVHAAVNVTKNDSYLVISS